jgi:hypothetical protein
MTMRVLLPPAGGSLSRVLALAALCPLHTKLSPDSPNRAAAARLTFGCATPEYRDVCQQCVCRPRVQAAVVLSAEALGLFRL